MISSFGAFMLYWAFLSGKGTKSINFVMSSFTMFSTSDVVTSFKGATGNVFNSTFNYIQRICLDASF